MPSKLDEFDMKKSIAVFSVFSILVLGYCTSLKAADEWPQFRGVNGQGHAATTGLPAKFSESQNVAWKTDIAGKGWSSPVITGDEIWMTTASTTEVSDEEKEKRLEKNTGSQPLDVAGELVMRAVCVQRSTGKIIHDVLLLKKRNPQPIHTLNSYASPTPILEDGKLYCHFGDYGTCCLDTQTAQVVWTNQDLHLNHENGPGSTPVLYKDQLIFHCDGSDVQFIVALDKKTGRVAWKTDRTGEMNSNPQLKKAYGTPLIVTEGGRDLLLSPAADWLYCYDPSTGKELWKLKYGVLGFSIVPRPVAGNGLLYMCTTYMKSELLAVRIDGKGETKEPHIAWRFTKQVSNKPSPLLIGNELYLMSDRGILTCVDAESGEQIWTDRVGGNHSSSPIYADGKIYFSSQEGDVTVIKPGRTFEVLAKNKLDGQLMASPAAVDGALFIRTDKALYRIENKK
ncbi:MAG: outer membrane protein assembly factor BamB [Pirellulaceae bacterium]|jgi:outer membrane protein assembly factor BamB